MGISVKKSIAVAWIIGCALSTFAAIVFLNGQYPDICSRGSSACTPCRLYCWRVWNRFPERCVAGSYRRVSVNPGRLCLSGSFYTNGAMSQAFPYVLMLVVLDHPTPGSVRMENYRKGLTQWHCYHAEFILKPMNGIWLIFIPVQQWVCLHTFPG